MAVRQRERADLVRLEWFVRENVLPRTTARRRVLKALGEAGGLCTARTRNSGGDIIVCTLDAGHYAPDDKPPFRTESRVVGTRWMRRSRTTWRGLRSARGPLKDHMN